MNKQNKMAIGFIIIVLLVPLLACNVPKTLANTFVRLFKTGEDSIEENNIAAGDFIEIELGATVVADDDYDSIQSELDELNTIFLCTIDTGSWYHLYLDHRPNSPSTVELVKTKFNFENSYPNLTFRFDFHGKGMIPRVDTEGNIYGYSYVEDIESGEGTGIWEDDFFFGSISYDRLEISTYNGETRDHKTNGELPVIGALSPNGKEIHVCLKGIGIDQFDMVKAQPFDQLRPACISNHYFICTPQ